MKNKKNKKDMKRNGMKSKEMKFWYCNINDELAYYDNQKC